MKFVAFLTVVLVTSTIYAYDGSCGGYTTSCGGSCGSYTVSDNCFSSQGGCGECFSSCGGCFSNQGGCNTCFTSQPKARPQVTPKKVQPSTSDLPQAIPIEPKKATILPSEEEAIPIPTKRATIRVQVPPDAIVIINDKQTTTTGENRTYVTWIYPNYVYDYKIVAWVKRDGVWHYQKKTIQLGETTRASLAFALPANTEQVAINERNER